MQSILFYCSTAKSTEIYEANSIVSASEFKNYLCNEINLSLIPIEAAPDSNNDQLVCHITDLSKLKVPPRVPKKRCL